MKRRFGSRPLRTAADAAERPDG